jgi:hypothetical protein
MFVGKSPMKDRPKSSAVLQLETPIAAPPHCCHWHNPQRTTASRPMRAFRAALLTLRDYFWGLAVG